MHNPKKSSYFGGGWKVLVVVVMMGYLMSTVLAFDAPVLASGSQQSAPTSPTSFQQEIQTDVATYAYRAWMNLVDFMQEGLAPVAKVPQILPQAAPEAVSKPEAAVFPRVQPMIAQSESTVLHAFSDIAHDSNRESIDVLASIGIVKGGQGGKYHPHNHVRCSDFIRVILDLYRYKSGYTSESQNWYSDAGYFQVPNMDPLLLKKLNTAYALGLLDKLGTIELEKPITPTQVQQIINNTLNLNPSLGAKEKLNLIDLSGSVVTKSQMAQYVVAIFQLEKPMMAYLFYDISNHKYQAAITKLAQLGVVAGKNGNFYPDNNVSREEAIIMIANSMQAREPKSLLTNTFTFLDTIHDATYFAAYAPHLEYLLTNEIWNFLLHPQLSGYLFLPHADLTQWEAYTLIAQAARVKLLNMDIWESSRPITRGELAYLIVQAFDFAPQISSNAYPQQMPPTGNANPYLAIREEKKGLLVSFLKDMLDTI